VAYLAGLRGGAQTGEAQAGEAQAGRP
jgi:hypothetical protein